MLPLTLSDKDLDAAVRTVFGEARGEPFEGQVAVCWVIRNRAEWHPPEWWGHTVETVCYHPQQFSCFNPDDPNRKVIDALSSNNLLYLENGVVRPVMAGQIPDPTEGATHYHAIGSTPKWIEGRQPTVTIGKHVFYALGPSA
jgi:N-acetylmuramoyl-L-alanine amidase